VGILLAMICIQLIITSVLSHLLFSFVLTDANRCIYIKTAIYIITTIIWLPTTWKLEVNYAFHAITLLLSYGLLCHITHMKS
jgi:uncharacterized membrane protein